jgi:hypothetical protein
MLHHNFVHTHQPLTITAKRSATLTQSSIAMQCAEFLASSSVGEVAAAAMEHVCGAMGIKEPGLLLRSMWVQAVQEARVSRAGSPATAGCPAGGPSSSAAEAAAGHGDAGTAQQQDKGMARGKRLAEPMGPPAKR